MIGDIKSGLTVIFAKLQFYKDQITELQEKHEKINRDSVSKESKRSAGDPHSRENKKKYENLARKIKRRELLGKSAGRRMGLFRQSTAKFF